MDERFLKEDGAEIFTGNELLVKGALESGVALITGYPGSPVSEVFDCVFANRELLKKHGILAEMANNEALAVARLNGARMAGVRALAVMKSVGLHVAADGLALGNLSEPNNQGGSLVVVGDDPWIDSTQINNDSRFLSRHLHMPVIEPATFQEMKDWMGIAFELSSAANLYLTYLVTTHQADGGGTVWVRRHQYPLVNTNSPMALSTAAIDLERNVLLPPRTWRREGTLGQRFKQLLSEARARGVNRVVEGADGETSVGFVTSGLSYCYLEHALSELGLSGRFPILKLGITYPLDPETVLSFAASVAQLVVVEEKRSFIEDQVIQILHTARQSDPLMKIPNVWGKVFPKTMTGFPESRGLNASIVAERLIDFMLDGRVRLGPQDERRLLAERAIIDSTGSGFIPLPVRTPTFCPGCPHRDSSSVFLEIERDFKNSDYMQKTHNRAPLDLIFHGETGCFTMLMFEPNTPLMHNYSGMGLGGGTGAGLDSFVTNKQVVFLGDSTFFHSGMVAISDSIKNDQDITYVILDNKTTAMTGHQPTPGTDLNLMGERTFAQQIDAIVQGMIGQKVPVVRVNPENRDAYRALLEDTVLQTGVKVVIADKECGLTYHRQRRRDQKAQVRRQGFLSEERHVNVTPDACEYCLECTNTTGCPGLTVEETLFGPKIVTDLNQCVSDGACGKVKVCPAFEEVFIERSASPARRTLPDSHALPDAAMPAKVNSRWSAYIAGVGGMGAGLVSAVLAQAAHAEGFRILFADKKGLAVRNGGVYGHVILSRDGGPLSPIIPFGKADLILGIDLLEAARGCDPKQPLRVGNPERTEAVINTAQHLTIRMLLGKDDLSVDAAELLLRRHIRPGGYWAQDVSKLSQEWFGSELYANLILLGVAHQRGSLPLKTDSLEAAIYQSVPKEEREVNLNAFALGRWLVARPEIFSELPQPMNYRTLLAEKTAILEKTYGLKMAVEYRSAVEEAVIELAADDALHLHLALRAYELIHYEDLALAKRYIEKVLRVASRDRRSWQYQATRAVIENLFKVIAIKDEVYVAHLLTSPEKRARDRRRFHIDEARGDRVTYRHWNQPEFTVLGKKFRWDMKTQDWQLGIMKRLKFLRRILPSWHRDEKLFRDWYFNLVDKFEPDPESYGYWVDLLKTPEAVRGYREIRFPKMQAARARAESLLQEVIQSTAATQKYVPQPLP